MMNLNTLQFYQFYLVSPSPLPSETEFSIGKNLPTMSELEDYSPLIVIILITLIITSIFLILQATPLGMIPISSFTYVPTSRTRVARDNRANAPKILVYQFLGVKSGLNGFKNEYLVYDLTNPESSIWEHIVEIKFVSGVRTYMGNPRNITIIGNKKGIKIWVAAEQDFGGDVSIIFRTEDFNREIGNTLVLNNMIFPIIPNITSPITTELRTGHFPPRTIPRVNVSGNLPPTTNVSGNLPPRTNV